MIEPHTPADDLFRNCANGDSLAWEEFMQRYGTMIRITALRVARRFGIAGELESLVADFYVDLYQRRDRVLRSFKCDWPGSDVPYLKTVTANAISTLCRDITRRKKREHLFDVIPDSAQSRGEGPKVSIEDAIDILRRELDPARAQRDIVIFRLYYREGFTADEIARIRSIGLADAGVESVLHTCRKKLKNAIGREIQSKKTASEHR